MKNADTAARALRMAACLLFCGAFGACSGVSRLIKPDDPLTADEHFRRGAADETRGLPDDAIAQYEKAVRLNPLDPEALVALGNVEFKRGDFSSAEDDYLRALKVSPFHVRAQNNLAMTYLAQNKKLKEAERLAKAALQPAGPLRPYVLDTLASIYRAEGCFPEARAAQAQAVETTQGDALQSSSERL